MLQQSKLKAHYRGEVQTSCQMSQGEMIATCKLPLRKQQKCSLINTYHISDVPLLF